MKSVDRGVLPNSVCFSFTPPEKAKELFFYPTWCGHYYCTEEYFMRRKSYPPLLLVFVRNGILNVEYHGEKKKARRGDVVLLDCSEPHYYYADNKLEFLYIHFDGSNSHELCRHIMDVHGWLIQSENNAQIGRVLYDMVDLYEHNRIETPFESSMRIYHLFELLLAPTAHEKREQSPIDKTIIYIRAHVGEPITLESLAAQVNLSPFYFSHLFKRQTGFSPQEYVINTRIERAKALLLRTGKSISEIADEVGYSSSGALINLFSKRVGESPGQYRKSHQGLAR